MSGPIRYWSSPDLRDPTLVLAFAGWNDAGEAASSAATALLETLVAQRIASLDLDDFLDFTVVRPHMRGGEIARQIIWPTHEFYAVELPSLGFDLVVGLGVEPHLRWRSYCESVLELVDSLRIRRVILLAAFLDEVIYSQPIEVLGFASDLELADGVRMTASGYEGPTGIVGVLGEALRVADVPTVSLWARLPHYVSGAPNWRGALALLSRLEAMLGLPLDLSGLEARAGEFDQEVSEAISNDPRLAAYVRELKRRAFAG